MAARTCCMVWLARARATIGAVIQDIFYVSVGVARTPLLDRNKHLNQRIGGPTFALDAADSGGTAALVNLGHGFWSREDLVQIADGTLIGVARVGTPDARRIGHHRLEFLRTSGSGSVI